MNHPLALTCWQRFFSRLYFHPLELDGSLGDGRQAHRAAVALRVDGSVLHEMIQIGNGHTV